MGSKRVCKLWEKVKGDVRKVFSTKKIFLKAFRKWKIKKTKKKQALGVEAEQIKMTFHLNRPFVEIFIIVLFYYKIWIK